MSLQAAGLYARALELSKENANEHHLAHIYSLLDHAVKFTAFDKKSELMGFWTQTWKV